MSKKKNIFIINGSASSHSSNEKLIHLFVSLTENTFNCKVFNRLRELPPFDPELSLENTPESIVEFRKQIEAADGIIICTPEYIFSIPSGLKNALEWCVSTTVFSNKAAGLITASAQGEKGHEELQLILKTVMANFSEETTLLIQGIKGKMNAEGELSDATSRTALHEFIKAYLELLNV